jgi:CRP-like cAMP-binding protein
VAENHDMADDRLNTATPPPDAAIPPGLPHQDHANGAIHGPSSTYEGQVLSGKHRWEHPAQRSFWHSLTGGEREMFTTTAKEQIFWTGTTLCRQDDTTTDVLVIQSGWTKVTIDDGREEKIVAVRGPGEIVGERAALATLAVAFRSASVVALNDVHALVISADRFRTLLTDHPRILEVLRRQDDERIAEDSGDTRHSEQPDVERRLAGLLLELALRRGGYERDGAVTITLPMSLIELANWADALPDAVSWCLSSWRQLGIIHATEQQVTVVDAAGLEQICGVIATGHQSPRRSGPALFGATPWAPLNCSIFYTDIAAFGDPQRDDDDRRVVRDALYRILQEAFEGSGVPWAACVHEDRGDGILSIAPPTVSTVCLVDPLQALLAAKLKRYNRQAGAPVRIQLRAALHLGPVYYDRQGGLCGHALIQTARLLDAPALKRTLADSRADLAFISSEHVYDTVIRHVQGLVDPLAYQRIPIGVKEATYSGWMVASGGVSTG